MSEVKTDSESVTDSVTNSNSTHRVEVVPIELQPHGNADTLSVVNVYGYSVVVRTEDWVGKTKGIYVPPDNLCPVDRPEFSFLAPDARASGKARVKAKKLRGVLSFGLLVPAPENAQIGEDWTQQLGVEHYDPQLQAQCGTHHGGLKMGGEVAKAPDLWIPKYDLEAGRRYSKNTLRENEPVVVFEKIHGASSRYVYHDGKLHVGSRTEWKKEYPTYDHLTLENLTEKTGDSARAQEILSYLHAKKPEQNMWWKALERHPEVRRFCEENPGLVFYAECYGAVQDLSYGHKKGEVSLAGFDILRGRNFLDYNEAMFFRDKYQLPWAPLVAGPVPFDFKTVCELAEGPSLVPGANHLREGVVVRPVEERVDARLGRAVLKWVSGAYLERSK